MKNAIDDFYIFSTECGFEDRQDFESQDRCVVGNTDIFYRLRDGEPLSSLFPLNNSLQVDTFDIVFHASPATHVNTSGLKAKSLVWTPGFSETVHPLNSNLLCHNYEGQQPTIKNPLTKVYQFVLGMKMPKFQEYQKNDFIFQCSNHYSQINSGYVARLAQKYKIMAYFAGPVAGDSDLLDFIDNVHTFYLGEIDEKMKIEFLTGAKIVTALYSHSINETPLAAKQALSYNCGIVTTGAGHIGKIVKDGHNGFIVSKEEDFIKAWENRNLLKQYDCWKSIQGYSLENMVNSFERVVKSI